MRANICVLVPCFNEEESVAGVVEEFKSEFPTARVIVVDNASTDATARVAHEAGAQVIREPRRGKAQAVLAALSSIDEELLIMVDGDGTYPAKGASCLVERYCERPVDMVTGVRCVASEAEQAFRPFHQFGTRAFAAALAMTFGSHPRDVFSGLRLFSKRFYQNVPVLSRGFELEMEMTIQCIDKGFTMAEVEVPFRSRMEGSASKLRTVRDGVRILAALVLLLRDYRPAWSFGLMSLLLVVAGSLAGAFPVREYLATGQVLRFPLAILAAGLMNLALATLLTGVMLESGLRQHRESWQIGLRQLPLLACSA